jgi:hypothetical protein
MAPARFGAGFGTPIPAPGPSSLPRHPTHTRRRVQEATIPHPAGFARSNGYPSGRSLAANRRDSTEDMGLASAGIEQECPSGACAVAQRWRRRGLRGRTSLEEKGLARWRSVRPAPRGTAGGGHAAGGSRSRAALQEKKLGAVALDSAGTTAGGERAAAGGSPGGGACDSSREETENGQR